MCGGIAAVTTAFCDSIPGLRGPETSHWLATDDTVERTGIHLGEWYRIAQRFTTLTRAFATQRGSGIVNGRLYRLATRSGF